MGISSWVHARYEGAEESIAVGLGACRVAALFNKFDQADGVQMIHEIPKSIKNFYTENRRLSKRYEP
jgi:hypothetical protein